MSRTYRKPRWPVTEYSEAGYISKQLSWPRNKYTIEYSYKPKEQYEAEIQEAEEAYKLEIKANKGSPYKNVTTPCGSTYLTIIRRAWVSSIADRIYHPIPLEKVIADAKAEYAYYTRDGKCSQSGTRRNFKQDCARTNRRNNRNYCKRVMRDDWEDKPYPNYHETDFKTWVWW